MIREKLLLVPNKPGCYSMKNKDNIIIYVGKAKKLKNRLNSYFKGSHTGKTAKLVSEIVDFEYIVVNSEIEALILELNLIKEYDPKYNILLKDDKSYPYIEITNEKLPRLLVVRNIKKKKSNTNLFGPYPNVGAARNTVNLLNRIYPLRKCKNYSKKTCLYYHIDQCLGYCTFNVDQLKIDDMVKNITRFLKGDHSLVTKELKERMEIESNKMNYEKAKEYKELLDYIDIVLTKQKVEIKDIIDIDVFGYAILKGYISIQTLFIRGGKILDRDSKVFPLIDEVENELVRYIANYYDKGIILPKEIIIPQIDTDILGDYLNTKVIKPIKGTKKKLVMMASKNAEIALNESFELIQKNDEKTIVANEELKKLLEIDKLDRIEIFDNSNLFGNYNVSGMVVFVDGVPSKKDYRKFKITNDKNDDYGTMREVIYRRYFRVLNENLVKPDLIIVDGGIGQINVARETIESLNLNIPVVGLKKDEYHSTSALLAFSPIEEVKINKRSNLFYYLERIQDEVHNFTINYHKQIRSKGQLSSILDSIKGIGPKRRDELIKKYRTINKIKEASLDELSKTIPIKVAEELLNELNKNNYNKDIN